MNDNVRSGKAGSKKTKGLMEKIAKAVLGAITIAQKPLVEGHKTLAKSHSDLEKRVAALEESKQDPVDAITAELAELEEELKTGSERIAAGINLGAKPANGGH